MSLDKLRALRRSGKRPENVVVFIGQPVGWDDDVRHVVVDRAGTDLRPLIGLPVHLIEVRDEPDLMLSTIEELKTLGAPLLGACTFDGKTVGCSEAHEQSVRRYWRLACGT